MKAKRLVTLTLPVMLLAGCITETYGLTQSEFRQVDKEFKADKMIKDMKQLHYSDEQIEKQLRMALAQLKHEEEMKKIENDKYKGIETEEDIEKDKKKESIEDNETVFEKKAKEKVTVTEERYPYQLYEIYARLQYQIEYLGRGMEKSINERSATVNYTKQESKLVDTQLNYIINLVPIGKYESNYPLLEEGVSKLREALELIVNFGMRAQNPLYPDNKLPEGFDKANDMIIDVLSTWQPIFDEIDKDFPDAKRKAEKKVERNVSDDTEGEFRIHKLSPKKVSIEENNNDY